MACKIFLHDTEKKELKIGLLGVEPSLFSQPVEGGWCVLFAFSLIFYGPPCNLHQISCCSFDDNIRIAHTVPLHLKSNALWNWNFRHSLSHVLARHFNKSAYRHCPMYLQ